VKRREQRNRDRAQATLPAAAARAQRAVEDTADDNERESPVWRFIGMYLTLVLVGFIAFRHPAMMVGGNELSVDRAMFTSVNAVTLTGFQQPLALDEYRLPGQIAALLLTIAATVVTLVAGGMAVSRIARTCCADRTIIVAACALELLAIVVGAIGLTGRGRGVFESIFQAVSAFGNSGLLLGTLPDVTDGRTHLVLLPLSLLGGMGIPVLLCIAASIRQRKPLHDYARFTLMLWAASYVVGLIVLAFLTRSGSWREALATASVQSINSRTTGHPFPIGNARMGHWFLIALMAIGGISGAAAGGIKLTTLAKLYTGTRAAMRGLAPGRVFGIALMWVVAYVLLVFATLLGVLATNPDQPADRLLFLVVSAVSNVGLAHNPVSIVGPGMFILSAAMFLGRVLPLAVLWWTVHVSRGEEEMPVG
jgi:Trk-type K+ transport system membrane component